ncbi:helix-turn-helix domain-containing protein [Streptomyces sp. NPDC059928]|uniref:helix-turn-helix domain-containing protein n=1 Tax=Streptomyces sp. NPDC059928 TaxID=3347007 RepID=UPI00365E5F98
MCVGCFFMVPRGPRAVEVVLSAEEREELARWADGGVSVRAAERAGIILACADGASNTAVAADFGVSTETVRKWRSRFVARRLAGLADAPRPGRRKPALVLSEAERAELTPWARRAKTASSWHCARRSCCGARTAGRTRRSLANSASRTTR